MSEKILDIKEERLSFFTPAGEVKALNGVSFAMNQGDVLGIVGESGSGKSVTAYSVVGLTAYPGKLVGGTVWFNGHEIEKMKEKEKERKQLEDDENDEKELKEYLQKKREEEETKKESSYMNLFAQKPADVKVLPSTAPKSGMRLVVKKKKTEPKKVMKGLVAY